LAAFQYANNPQTTLSGAVTAGATSISVVSAAGFPARGKFTIIVDTEIMLVTGVAGLTWTVVRGSEDTAAAAHNNNAVVTGILTKASFLGAHVIDVRAYGAAGDGVADDTAAIQAAHDALVASGGRGIVWLPPDGTYKITGTLQINATYASLHSAGAVINASDSLANAIQVSGSVDPPYNQATQTLQGFRVTGPSRTSGTSGILFHDASANADGPSHISVRNVVVDTFGRGLQFESRAHNISVYSTDVYECDRCIDAPAGFTDGGERLAFFGCTFFNSNLAVWAYNSEGELRFTACSFDYNLKQFDISGGKVGLTECHIEAEKATYTSTPISVAGDGGLFTMHGGWLLQTGDGAASNAYVVNVGHANAYAYFDGVFMNNNQTTTGKFGQGVGPLRVTNTHSYATSLNPRLLSDFSNSLSDSGFELAAIVDNIFVSSDTAAITSRITGTNVNIALSTAWVENGAQALRIRKVGGTSTNAAITIAAPISPRSFPAFKLSYSKPGTEAGSISIASAFATLQENGNGVPVVGKTQDIDAIEPTFTSTATGWIQHQSGEPSVRAPAWATHLIVTISLFNFPAGDIYIDNAFISEL